ncbi:MAG: alpha/beta hydrolase [Alphaproteobacteria bacterium]
MTTNQIDPELRAVGAIAKLIFRPSKWFFKLVRFMNKRGAGKPIPGMQSEERWIESSTSTRKIRLCIYRPLSGGENLPTLLYIHGGGYAMGSPEMSAPAIQKFMAAHPCVIIAPAYCCSLEAPYPAAIDDCYDALLWTKENATSVGGRDDQIIVGGHSAGGGLTAAVTLRARDRGDVNIAFQMPIYPMIDDRMTTASATGNTAPVWNSKHNTLGWRLYLKDLHEAGADIPYDAAPARATDYAGLPPTLTFVGSADPFHDETVAYVENLRAAGIPVEFEQFPGGFHGFEVLVPKAGISQAADAFLYGAFAKATAAHFAPQNP